LVKIILFVLQISRIFISIFKIGRNKGGISTHEYRQRDGSGWC